MGNSIDIIHKVPADLSTSTLNQLQEVIEQAIIHTPWNENTEGKSPEFVLRSTVSEMAKRGYRPITAEEYLRFLKQKQNRNIGLWVPSSKDADEDEMVITLPSCTEELTERAMTIEENLKTCSDGATISQLETVAWATGVTYSE